MTETMKNRDIHPVGTRVRIAQDKLSTRVGTVVAHDEDRPERMSVHWDGDPVWRVLSGFSPVELKQV